MSVRQKNADNYGWPGAPEGSRSWPCLWVWFFFNESTFFLHITAEWFCSVLCLHDSREWHLPYSVLLVFDLPFCPELPGFSSLFLDIRTTAVQITHLWVQWCSVVGFCVLQLISFFVKWATVKSHTLSVLSSSCAQRGWRTILVFLPVCCLLAFKI